MWLQCTWRLYNNNWRHKHLRKWGWVLWGSAEHVAMNGQPWNCYINGTFLPGHSMNVNMLSYVYLLNSLLQFTKSFKINVSDVYFERIDIHPWSITSVWWISRTVLELEIFRALFFGLILHKLSIFQKIKENWSALCQGFHQWSLLGQLPWEILTK